MDTCRTCEMPEPANHCWANRFDCPFGKLPRVFDTREAVALLAWLLAELTWKVENPPCCKGGPQWGHAWDCPSLP